jgi:nickel transport protein
MSFKEEKMKRTLIGAFIFICSIGLIQAHKLEVHLTENPPVVIVKADYGNHDHGVSGGDVFIYAPGEADTVFQSGKTDPSGKFAFIPDKAGEWRVLVDDGTGHKGEAGIMLEDAFFAVTGADLEIEEEDINPAPPAAALSVFWKALIGISLLIGIAGIFYGLKSRKESAKG